MHRRSWVPRPLLLKHIDVTTCQNLTQLLRSGRSLLHCLIGHLVMCHKLKNIIESGASQPWRYVPMEVVVGPACNGGMYQWSSGGGTNGQEVGMG